LGKRLENTGKTGKNCQKLAKLPKGQKITGPQQKKLAAKLRKPSFF